jgi:mutator protein MutT
MYIPSTADVSYGLAVQWPMMRRSSQFIPYRFINGQWFLFVQKRTKDAAFAPNMFGIFGGQHEGDETPETALFREIREELDYQPSSVSFFRKYEYIDWEAHVFVAEVGENFENEVRVLEGQYGRFLSEAELQAETLMGIDRIVLNDVFRWLRKQSKLSLVWPKIM